MIADFSWWNLFCFIYAKVNIHRQWTKSAIVSLLVGFEFVVNSKHSPNLLNSPAATLLRIWRQLVKLDLNFRGIDGTFKVVMKPYYQLLTVNCFVKTGRQLPGVYVLMTGKSEIDYTQVLFKTVHKTTFKKDKLKCVL